MSIKNYIPLSIKLTKLVATQDKMFKVKFINGTEIMTLIRDGTPLQNAFYEAFYEQPKTPRSFDNIYKYNVKSKQIVKTKKYNTEHILSFELVSSITHLVTLEYTYEVKGWFSNRTHLKYINIPMSILGVTPNNINLRSLDGLCKQYRSTIINHILKTVIQ